jgi:PAS domain S-box-containing protein
VHAHYVPDRAPDGDIRGMVSFVQDVTEQKQAERALRESEERFRRMVEIAVEGIWIVDTTARTTFVNNRMADILGYTREEMLGRQCFEFFDPEERKGARLDFEEQRRELHKILSAEPHEHHFRHKDGSSVWLDITGTPMTDDSGTFTGVLKMCADVTERKKSDQRLRQAQKLESLGILAGGVAHDFNNLLTAIIGNASLVLERTEPASPSRMMLQALITASERAAQLTRQLLTYAGKDHGTLQPLDLAAIVRELVPLLTAIIPKMVNLSLELEDGIHLVEADPAQLQHVMMNLVINAAESIPAYTPGEVKIAVGRRTLQSEDYRDAVVPIETSDREYVWFRVTDNGSGHGCRHAVPNFRSFLHHQVPGTRTGPRCGARNRERARRNTHRTIGSATGKCVDGVVAGDSGGRGASGASATPIARNGSGRRRHNSVRG